MTMRLLVVVMVLEQKMVEVYANGFIRPFKSPAGTLILFDRKLDGSLRLFVDYRNLNNLTIAMSALIARTVRIVMTSLTLLDKLGKI